MALATHNFIAGYDIDRITGDKILQESSRPQVDLRKLILLCNTYDIRQVELGNVNLSLKNEISETGITTTTPRPQAEFRIEVIQCFDSDSDSDSDSNPDSDSDSDEDSIVELWTGKG